MGRLFGTDGVRGVANKDLTNELAMKIGMAAAEILLKRAGDQRPTVMIGRDTRASGDMLEAALTAYARRACAAAEEGAFAGMLLGICGGLQMLGASLHDPLHLEDGGSMRGMSLLPLLTTLAAAKTLRQSHARAAWPLAADSCMLSGYEIHHGVTRLAEEYAVSGGLSVRPLVLREDGTPVGWGLCREDALPPVWGSYLHGILDDDVFRHTLLRRVRAAAGRAPAAEERPYSLGPELDRLADTVEAHCDWPRILTLLGL